MSEQRAVHVHRKGRDSGGAVLVQAKVMALPDMLITMKHHDMEVDLRR